MKPHVTCHMVCSVDGKILASRWGKGAAQIFEETAAILKSDGWIVGRVTMSEFSAKKSRIKRKGRFVVAKTDYRAPHKQKTYAIAIDPSGKLSWDVNHVDTEHVIAVLTKKVSSEYLNYLRSRQVSYIFGGAKELDLARVLEKLNKRFGIRRVTLQGGGSNNGSFLNEGLIDELSLIIMPFADGETGTQSVFDIAPADQKNKAVKLELKSSKVYKKNHVWMRYRVLNR